MATTGGHPRARWRRVNPAAASPRPSTTSSASPKACCAACKNGAYVESASRSALEESFGAAGSVDSAPTRSTTTKRRGSAMPLSARMAASLSAPATVSREMTSAVISLIVAALGGALGAIAVLTKHEIVWMIIGGVFVAEALSVIIQVFWFKRTGKRVFLMAPIHHHFEKKGYPESQIVIRFWIIALVLAMVGLATLKVR